MGPLAEHGIPEWRIIISIGIGAALLRTAPTPTYMRVRIRRLSTSTITKQSSASLRLGEALRSRRRSTRIRGRSLRSKMRGRHCPQMSTDRHRCDPSRLGSVPICVYPWAPFFLCNLCAVDGLLGMLVNGERYSECPSRHENQNSQHHALQPSTKKFWVGRNLCVRAG